MCVFMCMCIYTHTQLELYTYRTKLEYIKAYIGTTSLNGADGNTVKVSIKKVVQHPSYNPIILDFDVAVLELASPLLFNKYIQPVCLPLAVQKFPVGKKCMISGWGNIQEGNSKQCALFIYSEIVSD